jgi:hypothetical protein
VTPEDAERRRACAARATAGRWGQAVTDWGEVFHPAMSSQQHQPDPPPVLRAGVGVALCSCDAATRSLNTSRDSHYEM